MTNRWFDGEGDLASNGHFDEVAAENAANVVVVDTGDLRDALKPLVKQKSGAADDPQLLAALLVPDGDVLRLKTTDLVTYVSTEVPVDEELSRMPAHPVAVDLAALDSLAKVQGETTTIAVSEGGEASVLFAGGSLHLPTYLLQPSAFDASAAVGEPVDSWKSPAIVLLEMMNATKKLAAAADRADMRMLFGARDYVYACDGVTVVRSDCYFVPTAVKLSDVDVVEALLQGAAMAEQATLTEYEDYVSVAASIGTATFPKRTVSLARQYTDAVRDAEDYFFVDAKRVHDLLKVLGAVRDTGGYATFAVEVDDEPVLTMYSKAEDGSVSRVVVSREFVGEAPEEAELRMRIPSAVRALYGFASGDVAEVCVGGGQMVINDANAKATVIMGTVGSDRA